MTPRPLCVIVALLILAFLLFCCFQSCAGDFWDNNVRTIRPPKVVVPPSEPVKPSVDVLGLKFSPVTLSEDCPVKVGCYTTPKGSSVTVWMEQEGSDVLVGLDTCLEVRALRWDGNGECVAPFAPATNDVPADSVALPTATVPKAALDSGVLYLEYVDSAP